MAEAHGGDVTVESTEGEGSTFRLSLPLAEDTNESRRHPDARTPTILVVDDEQSYRDALSVALQREGFVVETAADGPEAISRFDAARPALVLLDVMLPHMSGVDVCRELRARSQVPIIMVTARNAEIDAVVGLEVGADDYVTKPFRLRELVARVRAALRRAPNRDGKPRSKRSSKSVTSSSTPPATRCSSTPHWSRCPSRSSSSSSCSCSTPVGC